ncbi:MAG: hypothetical protein K2I96_17650 [Lachnospiraceae bacterium]|nr:hypothetical protein [Lachnospiraceae bacterium]
MPRRNSGLSSCAFSPGADCAGYFFECTVKTQAQRAAAKPLEQYGIARDFLYFGMSVNSDDCRSH